MDFDQIRAFLNVAALKSFSAAAEKMFISQPSVSMKIKALEEELGVVLFDRSKAREPSLTEAGRIFFDYAQSIANLQDQCREKLSGKRTEDIGLIFIGASTVPGTYLLPRILKGYRELLPGINFHINLLDTSAVIEGIFDYSYELGFVGSVKEDERLVYHPLIEDELVFCIKKDTLPAQDPGAGISTEEILNHNLIMREKGSATRHLLENRIIEKGFAPSNLRGAIYFNSLEGIKQAVREGLGAAVLSLLSVGDMVKMKEIDCYSLNDLDLKRMLYLVYHRSRILGGAAASLRDYIIKEFT